MIKFFRHIRQNLLMENKTGKYFKYAIGEILLVVIGILIALQINNWNEGRKRAAEERLLLSNLKLSFERKLDELESKNIGRQRNIEGIDFLLRKISNRESVSHDSVYNYISDLWIWFAVNEEFSVIDMLFSSGKINTISNDMLKSKLIEWPDKMEEMLEEQRVVQSLVVNKISPVLRKYISLLNLRNAFMKEENPEAVLIESPYQDDIEGLLSDKLFESLITEKSIYLITNVTDTEILIQDAKIIIENIEQELKE